MKSRHMLAVCCWMVLLATGIVHGENAVWSDDFEGSASKRWTGSSIWHIGSPTAGPATNSLGYRAHSGTNCATTQGYATYQDFRMICTNYNNGVGTNIASTLQIPSADQFPRLRFWHWFNLEYALGFVEISTDSGANWTQISPTYTYAVYPISGSVWSRPYIDLSPYAGQNVQFAFRFYGVRPNNGLGWYIDDVAVVTSTNAPAENLPEGFEFDPKASDWSVDYGTWEIGKPTSGPGSAHSGTNCAATELAGNFANLVESRLISPPFVVPANSPTLRFWHWYSFGNDGVAWVEINNGEVTTTSVTNTTITTNASPNGPNTNVYQLVGPLNTDYIAPFYWNQAIGGWTNATKALGAVFDQGFQKYYYDAGSAPLAHVSGTNVVDYRVNSFLPIPQSLIPTNFLNLQGQVWNSTANTEDNPIGYFGTNYTYTYTTNTSIVTSAVNWNQVSPTYQYGSTTNKWVPVSIDLSAFTNQTVQLAFHFFSLANATAPGWYIDDISLATAPTLTVPANQTISYGQTATNLLSATNSVEPGSVFTFGLAAPSTSVVVATNGLVTWTNKIAPPGTYPIYVQVTDGILSVTNSFSYTVLPLSSQLVISNAVAFTNGGGGFKFSIKTPWTNSTWVLLASTNLAGNTITWVPIYTNQTGPGGALSFTDLLSTNFLQRYYRAVFP